MVGDVVGTTSHINLPRRDGNNHGYTLADFAAEVCGVWSQKIIEKLIQEK